MTRCAFIPNFLKFYNILWRAVLPFLKRNPRLAPTFDRRVHPRLGRADIWLQAASAGEAFLALSILSRLAPAAPLRVLVTTTTDQGLDLLGRGLEKEAPHPGLTVALDLFPFDTQNAVATAVAQVAPRVMVLLETELWPAILHELKQQQVPVLILNARMSKRSAARYRKTRWLWNCLAPDRVLAISKEDRNRYRAVFPDIPSGVMDNIKFDIMESPAQQSPARGPELKDCFPGSLPLSVLASFRRQEEGLITDLVEELRSEVPDQIIALFPRHMHRIRAVKKNLQRRGIPFVLRSEMAAPATRPCVILWDRFGELRQAYAFASTVFVGGSLKPLGGQNFIEPAVLGIPTITGPFWDDFAWAGQEIFSLGFVSSVPDAGAAARAMAEHLKALPDVLKNRERAEAYMASRRGGSDTACRVIFEAMKPL